MWAVQLAFAYAAVLIATAGQAQAAEITLFELQPQKFIGQFFTFTFSGVPTISDGGGGTLRIGARGDFSPGGQNDEYLDFSAEGVVTGTGVSFDTPGSVLLNDFSSNDKEFVHTVALTGANLDTLIGDGTVTVTVDFGSGANIFDSNSYASVELTYATVPESSSLAIFGIGAFVMGFVSIRRRRRAHMETYTA